MEKIVIAILYLASSLLSLSSYAEDGYELWLRYARIEDRQLSSQYLQYLQSVKVNGQSETLNVLRSELQAGLRSLLDHAPQTTSSSQSGRLLIARTDDPDLADFGITDEERNKIGREGFLIRAQSKDKQILITATSDQGLLYGTFHFLRILQMHQDISSLNILSTPPIDLRILNHWDNLDRTSERGYAGFSLWDWHKLPDYLDPRYVDYARANASLGINGTVLTNVNANALVLTPAYLEKAKALAEVFRPYGIRVYLTARFSAPIETGGLKTADPLDPEVKKWWANKVSEIYSYIPDFGGMLVKANSEGQPGPQDYGRSHADGANMLADALAPYEGVVMWRAFVYSDEEPDDRAKQAYNEFKPLDGDFRENVLIQVKNGAIDFQPREPFHPLFGAMPETPLMMEFQITQEYLGQATQLVYLAPMYKEVLEADTYARGKGSTVAKVIDGSLHKYPVTGMAGVANTGTDRNWTGHPFGQSNWYAFGRLAWNTDLSSGAIADEWIRLTWGNDETVLEPIKQMMLMSHEAAVNYMTPLGLHHLMGTGHHYGPAPWVDDLPRADWTPAYYHQADSFGIGFDRSLSGSNATGQYFPEVASTYASLETCPEKYLLWFHHVSWDHTMDSGRSLWEELNLNYQDGVNAVRKMQSIWNGLKEKVDPERHRQVQMLLTIQEKEAIWWKNACLLYFQTFSNKPFPNFVETPEHTLEYFRSLRFPYAPGIRPRW